jgi:hypothetical protein
MTDPTGRHVKLSDDDLLGIKKLVWSGITRIFTGVLVAGCLGAISLVLSFYVAQAKQEEYNKAVLEKIDYKYQRLAEGQAEAKEQVKLIVDPLQRRLNENEDAIKFLLRREKHGDQ